MISRLKNILGIEGVKIDIVAPDILDLSDEMLEFELHFHTKSEQLIESVNMRLIEKYKRGWGNSKLIDEYILFDETEDIQLSISPDERFTVPLSVDFSYTKSPVEKLGDNILLRPISKLALLTKRAGSSFRLEVTASVKGVKMNPYSVHHFIKAKK